MQYQVFLVKRLEFFSFREKSKRLTFGKSISPQYSLEKKMDLFGLLPTEILKEILAITATTEDLLSLKLVCKRFKTLIDLVYDHNKPDGIHFMWNMRQGNSLEVKRLLGDDRIISMANQYHYFYYAVIVGHLDTIRFLIEDSRVDPDLKPNEWKSCHIVVAYLDGRMDIVDLLLDHPRINLNNSPINRYLYEIIQFGLIDLAERVYPKLDIALYSFRHLAEFPYRHGRVHLLEYVLERSYPHSIDEISEIVMFISPGNEQVLCILLDHPMIESADIEIKSRVYEFAIDKCLARGFTQAVKKILAKNILLGHLYVHNGHNFDTKVLAILLESSNVNFVNPQVPLVRLGDKKLIGLFLKRHHDKFRVQLFREALVQKNYDIATYVSKGVSKNMWFMEYSFNDLFNSVKVEGIQFAINNLGILVSRSEYTRAFILTCDSLVEKRELFGELLDRDDLMERIKWFLTDKRVLLTHSIIKRELLPLSGIQENKNLVHLISSFIQ